VITEPMPSMPLFFWGDEAGERLRESYFSMYPGIWRHGDWIRITPRGGAVIYGRSDSTINRQGVRMGTSEIYRAVLDVDEIVDALVLPLVEKAVPEWQATLDALLSLPEIDGPVGYAGGVIAIGIRLAVVEPRISAAGFFAGSFVPATLFEEARQITIPLQVLLQWDDEGNDRQSALDLFDAFGSKEKTLHANLGGHTGVPQFEVDDGARFFARHLS
jgi:hypothetical protein